MGQGEKGERAMTKAKKHWNQVKIQVAAGPTGRSAFVRREVVAQSGAILDAGARSGFIRGSTGAGWNSDFEQLH